MEGATMALTKIRRSNDGDDDRSGVVDESNFVVDFIVAGDDDDGSWCRSTMAVTNRWTGNCTIFVWSLVEVGIRSWVFVLSNGRKLSIFLAVNDGCPRQNCYWKTIFLLIK